MVAIWEYVSLAGEVSTAAVDDVDARKSARSCDFLQPQMLLRKETEAYQIRGAAQSAHCKSGALTLEY